MALFITFEGIEGSGKTTQIKLLDDLLKLRGYQTTLTREPGGTAIGNQIRRIVLDSENKDMDHLCELMLYAAGRAQHIQQVIGPALKDGHMVLCDRFIDATMAYQGYGRGFDESLITKINQLVVDKVKPDVTFLLDCEPKLGLNRAFERMATQKSGPVEDRFEREPKEFHNAVRAGYLAIAKKEPKRFVIINGSQDIEAVHQEIAKQVLERLP